MSAIENEVHYGQMIKEKLKESGMPKAEFARRIHCSRSNVYDIFKRKSMNSELLKKISFVLDRDFENNHANPHC